MASESRASPAQKSTPLLCRKHPVRATNRLPFERQRSPTVHPFLFASCARSIGSTHRPSHFYSSLSPAPVGATTGRPLSPLAQKAHTASGISAAEKAFTRRRGKTVFENKERRGLPKEKSPPARSFLTCSVSDTARGENRPRYGGRCLVGHPCVHRCGRRTRYRCRARCDTARRGRDPPLPL